MRAALALALLAALAHAQDGLRDQMRAATDNVFPALVFIINVEEGFSGGRKEKSVSSGSGFFIDAEGHIVTNFHVAGKG